LQTEKIKKMLFMYIGPLKAKQFFNIVKFGCNIFNNKEVFTKDALFYSMHRKFLKTIQKRLKD